MLNNVNSFNYPDFPRKNYPIIDKDQLPKRPFDPIILNDSKNGGGYIAGSNKEVEEFKKSLAQSNSKKTGITNITTSYIKDMFPKEKLNLPFASFWGVEDGWV